MNEKAADYSEQHPIQAWSPQQVDPDLMPPEDLPIEDGQNMDHDWQRREIELLAQVVEYLLNGRDDYYAGGNMFVHFSKQQVRNREFRGPDFFVVVGGVRRQPARPYWAVWNENGRYPDLIVELLSPTTRHEDLTTKKDVYQNIFHTQNYFCYGWEKRELFGWRNPFGGYQPIPPNSKGWMWCDVLGVWIGAWEGEFEGYHDVWLRLYDRNGELIPTRLEATARQLELQAQQAEAALQQAQAAQQQAEAERRRADEEKKRSEALAAELAAMRAQVERK